MNSGLIIYDWIGTLVTRDGRPYDDALPMIEALDEAYIQVAISKADDRDRRLQEMQSSPFRDYLRMMIAVQEKTLELFQEISGRYNLKPEKTWVVDDRTRRGIQTGNQLGFKTIWLTRSDGEYLHETPNRETGSPSHTISSLTELTRVLLV